MGATIAFPTRPYQKTLIDWNFSSSSFGLMSVVIPQDNFTEYLLRFRAKINNQAVARSIGYLINGDVNTANMEGCSQFFIGATISTYPIPATDNGVFLGSSAVTTPNKNYYYDGWIRFYRYELVAAFIEIESKVLCRTIGEDNNTRLVSSKCTYSSLPTVDQIDINTMGSGVDFSEISYALFGMLQT